MVYIPMAFPLYRESKKMGSLVRLRKVFRGSQLNCVGSRTAKPNSQSLSYTETPNIDGLEQKDTTLNQNWRPYRNTLLNGEHSPFALPCAQTYFRHCNDQCPNPVMTTTSLTETPQAHSRLPL
jgi:hypothetical protein